MAFEGWLIKFGSTALPNNYLEKYKETPNQRLELDAYRDVAALLHRETSPNYKSKIVVPVSYTHLDDLLKVELDILPRDALLSKHGLQPGGPVQKMVDSETMRYMEPYMPRRQAGELAHMMVMATVIRCV